MRIWNGFSALSFCFLSVVGLHLGKPCGNNNYRIWIWDKFSFFLVISLHMQTKLPLNVIKLVKEYNEFSRKNENKEICAMLETQRKKNKDCERGLFLKHQGWRRPWEISHLENGMDLFDLVWGWSEIQWECQDPPVALTLDSDSNYFNTPYDCFMCDASSTIKR